MAERRGDIPYSLRRCARARRVRVSVEADGSVEVVLPKRAPERAARDAVRDLAGWIGRRRRGLPSARDEVARPERTVPFLGAPLGLVAEPGRTRVHRRGGVLLVPA